MCFLQRVCSELRVLVFNIIANIIKDITIIITVIIGVVVANAFSIVSNIIIVTSVEDSSSLHFSILLRHCRLSFSVHIMGGRGIVSLFIVS